MAPLYPPPLGLIGFVHIVQHHFCRLSSSGSRSRWGKCGRWSVRGGIGAGKGGLDVFRHSFGSHVAQLGGRTGEVGASSAGVGAVHPETEQGGLLVQSGKMKRCCKVKGRQQLDRSLYIR